jgi:hypothetical protein
MTISEPNTPTDSPSRPPPESNPPTTTPGRRTAGVGFRNPNPNPTGTTTRSMSPEPGSPLDFDPVDDASADPGSTPSSEPTTPVKFDTAALAEITRKAVLTGSLYVHQLLARTPEEEAIDLWIASERDQRQIGDPLASIGKRHSGAAAVTPDLADAIAAGIGLVAYLSRNIATAWQMRRARRKLAQLSPGVNHETGEPA